MSKRTTKRVQVGDRRRAQDSGDPGDGKRRSLRRPADVRRPILPATCADWRTTVQAYWQTVPNLTASDRLVNKLRLIAATPDRDGKLALLVDVLRSLTMSPGVMLATMLDAGLTREGHEIDRVAAEILAVL